MTFKLTGNIAFEVNNHRKAAEFYRDVMGMKILDTGTSESKMQCGDTVFYVEENRDSRAFFEFEVPSVAEAKKKLIVAGCKVTKEYSPKSMMIADPFGMRFHLVEKGAQLCEIGDSAAA